MMSNTAVNTLLKVYYIDPDDETKDDIFLGEIKLDSEGELTVISADPDYAEHLQESVNELNGKPALQVKTAPPPDTPMLQLHGEIYERSRPDFLEGLKQYALTYYSFRLLTEAELAQEVAENQSFSL
jgi:hypothetical protein